MKKNFPNDTIDFTAGYKLFNKLLDHKNIQIFLSENSINQCLKTLYFVLIGQLIYFNLNMELFLTDQ